MTYRRSAARTTVDTSSPRRSAVSRAASHRSSGTRTFLAVVATSGPNLEDVPAGQALGHSGQWDTADAAGHRLVLRDVAAPAVAVEGLGAGRDIKARHVTSVPTPVPTLSRGNAA